MANIRATEHFQHFLRCEMNELRDANHVLAIGDHDWIYSRELLCAIASRFQEEDVANANLAAIGGILGIARGLRTNIATRVSTR